MNKKQTEQQSKNRQPSSNQSRRQIQMKQKTPKQKIHRQAQQEYFCIPKTRKKKLCNHGNERSDKKGLNNKSNKQISKDLEFIDRLSKNESKDKGRLSSTPSIENQYHLEKRKIPKRGLQSEGEEKQLKSSSQYFRPGYIGQLVKGSISLNKTRQIQQKKIGKIRKNIYKEKDQSKAKNIRQRFYSHTLSNRQINKKCKQFQNSIKNGIFTNVLKNKSNCYQHKKQENDDENVKNKKFQHCWNSKDKKVGISINEQDGYYHINLQSKKLKPKVIKLEHIYPKSSSVRTLNSPRANINSRSSEKAGLIYNRNRERGSKSMTVSKSTATNDLKFGKAGNPEVKYESMAPSDNLKTNEIEAEQFSRSTNNRFRNTVLTQQAIVEEVKYLRSLTLQLFSQKQQLLQKYLQISPPVKNQ